MNKLEERRIALANELGILPTCDGLRHGQIGLANDTMFSESNANAPATGYAIDWKDTDGLEEDLNFIAPPVQQTKRFNYLKFTNAESMLVDLMPDLTRAIGGEFPELKPYTATRVNAVIDNRGMTMRLDRDAIAGQANPTLKATGKMLARRNRAELVKAVALLSAAATNTAKTWDTTAGKDPDMDMLTDMNTSATASGIRPNRIFGGEAAFTKRLISYRAQNNAAGYASAGLTEQGIGALLNAQVRQSHSRKQSSASAKAEIVNNLVLMFLAFDGMDEEDPSTIKRFWTPCEGGGQYRVYVQEFPKYIIVTLEWYSKTVITSTLGIRQFTVS